MNEAMACIVVMAAVTFSIRALPFVIQLPERVTARLARSQQLLPTLFMSLLVVYCLSAALSISDSGFAIWLREWPLLLSSLFVFVVHWTTGRLLISLGGGVILHLVLVNWV